ncbi:MAG: SUMF1/EgtB/PvdO family nonheme iron enzyme, partial [Victivallales bacterium]|nr:SUMF1/EgtB/PvdO family nonheme iron enzyme [Victivallales bacterium]
MDEEVKGSGIFDGAADGGEASSSRKSAVLKHIVSFWGLTVFLLLVVAFLLTAEVVRRRRSADAALKITEKAVSEAESSKGEGGADVAKTEESKAKAKPKKSEGGASSAVMDDDDELEDDTAEGEQKDDGKSAQKDGDEAGKASAEVSASLDGYGYPNNKESLEHLDMKEDDEGITLMLPNERTIRLVRVKSGSFIIGSKDVDGGRSLHEPEKKVTLTEDFWIGAHEVTRGEWKAVMECVTSIRDDKD